MHGSAGEFTLVECTRCGFLYLSPRPDPTEIGQYYPNDYLCYAPPLFEEKSRFRRYDRLSGLRKRCRLIAGRRTGGRLLDVGCATGDFLSVMRTFPHWEVHGLEMDATAADLARRTYGLTVDVGTLDSVTYANASFDAVTMWDVLEHLPEPNDALRTVHRLLRPEGVLVCGVPNRDSFDARVFGPYWAGLDVPRHFSVFSKADLVGALKQAGFHDAEVVFLSGSVNSFLLSVRFWIADLRLPAACYHFALRLVDWPLTRVALLPYMACVRLLGRGATFIVVARRGEDCRGD